MVENPSNRPGAVACPTAPISRKPRFLDWLKSYFFSLLKHGCITAILLAFVLTVGWIFRAPILQKAADFWIVSTTLEETYDIVVIPGGGLNTRPYAAAEIFHKGKAEGVVSFLTEVMPAEKMGLTRAADQVTLEILEQLHVPKKKIHIIGDHVTSTQDEVLALKEWTTKNEIKSLVIVTEIFPSRRVARVYAKEFRGTGISTDVFAITPKEYAPSNWWQHEQGLISFQNEVIKYFYYLMKYRNQPDA